MTEGHFEAKVSGKRESASGIFLTLQIQPDDFTADLATLRVGAALVLGWAEVVDPSVSSIDLYRPPAPTTTLTSTPPKDRKPFASLPLSQQCALRCQDGEFVRFLADSGLAEEFPDDWDAAEVVRKYCGIASRSELIGPASEYWLALEERFQSWLTDKRYADLVRA